MPLVDANAAAQQLKVIGTYMVGQGGRCSRRTVRSLRRTNGTGTRGNHDAAQWIRGRRTVDDRWIEVGTEVQDRTVESCVGVQSMQQRLLG